MGTIILNACGLLLIILLGYFMKRIGLMKKTDGTILSTIIMNITLPATIIVNLTSFVWHNSYFVLVVAALVFTYLQIALVWPFFWKQRLVEQEYGLFLGSGFNIGNFTLPFVQSFMPAGIPLISMFDLGNSIMLAGGTRAAIDFLVKKKDALNLRVILIKLFKTVPFTCYVGMTILRLFEVTLPNQLIDLLQPIGNANAFLSMFMIGLYLELKLPKHAMKQVFKVLGLRFLASLLMMGIALIGPWPEQIKNILILIGFAPIPTFGVINAVLAGADEEAVGFCSSLSFLLGLPLMTAVVIIFGIG